MNSDVMRRVAGLGWAGLGWAGLPLAYSAPLPLPHQSVRFCTPPHLPPQPRPTPPHPITHPHTHTSPRLVAWHCRWTFCYRKIETKAIEIGGDEGPQSPGKDEKADVLNIFHHQLAEVSVVKRKKFEFSIRTHYDEFDPMDKPEELLKLRAKTQDEFEAWVDALSTWSQGVNSMSLLTF